MSDKSQNSANEGAGRAAPTGSSGKPSEGTSADKVASQTGGGQGGKIVDMAQQKGGQTAGQAKEEASRMAEHAQQKAGRMAGQTREKSSEMLEQAREEVTGRLSGQKEMAADRLDDVAHAVRQTGSQLRSQEQTGVAQYADKAAEQIEHLSGFLREHDVEDLMHEAEGFGRRQPLVFLGGAFFLGFLGARFIRSSSRPDSHEKMRRPSRRSEYQRPIGPPSRAEERDAAA